MKKFIGLLVILSLLQLNCTKEDDPSGGGDGGGGTTPTHTFTQLTNSTSASEYAGVVDGGKIYYRSTVTGFS